MRRLRKPPVCSRSPMGRTGGASAAGHSGEPSNSRTRGTAGRPVSTHSVPARTLHTPSDVRSFAGGCNADPAVRIPASARPAVPAQPATTSSAVSGRSLRRSWTAPGRTTTSTSPTGSGTPNGSRSPLTTSVGSVGGQLVGPAASPACPAGAAGRPAPARRRRRAAARYGRRPARRWSGRRQISGRSGYGELAPGPRSTPRPGARPVRAPGGRPPGRAGSPGRPGPRRRPRRRAPRSGRARRRPRRRRGRGRAG